MIGRERLAVMMRGEQHVVAIEIGQGTLAVYPCSACTST